MARFEMHGAFKAGHLGIVFIDIVLEGHLHAGDLIRFDFKGEKLERRIKGLELVRAEDQRQIDIMIHSVNKKADAAMFKDWKPNKVIAEVTLGLK